MTADLFICFLFWFRSKAWLCDCDLSAHFCVHSLQSSWSRFSQNRHGHQWLSILWLKERASCCTCYARGVMFLTPWFTQQSIYWRRFKIHYHLVLPRKIVEQHSTIEVNTGLLQKKRWAQILPSSFCLHLCLATKLFVLWKFADFMIKFSVLILDRTAVDKTIFLQGLLITLLDLPWWTSHNMPHDFLFCSNSILNSFFIFYRCGRSQVSPVVKSHFTLGVIKCGHLVAATRPQHEQSPVSTKPTSLVWDHVRKGVNS